MNGAKELTPAPLPLMLRRPPHRSTWALVASSLALPLLLLLPPGSIVVDAALSLSPSSSSGRRAASANALRTWLLDGPEPRVSPRPGLELSVADDGGTVVATTTQPRVSGELLFTLPASALWSATSSYVDRDLGPKLRDYARIAGPGFNVVALSGAVAAERIRRYRTREGQGRAPESTGVLVPSVWGALARHLWTAYEERATGKDGDGDDPLRDESIAPVVAQGVNLLLPLLDTTARRAWSADSSSSSSSSLSAPSSSPAFLSEEWARRAMFEDDQSQSWSRVDLERLATDAFRLVLTKQRPPPPRLLGGLGTLIPAPFVASSDSSLDDNDGDDDGEGTGTAAAPGVWPDGENLALVPWVDDLFESSLSSASGPNAVLGSPPLGRGGGKGGRDGSPGDCLWCVATRDLEAGEIIVPADPWDVY